MIGCSPSFRFSRVAGRACAAANKRIANLLRQAESKGGVSASAAGTGSDTRGRCSETGRPGKLLGMDLNSPRISAGASGFMSHMSRWLGPPFKKMTMQESAWRTGAARSTVGSDNPSALLNPICTISRRDSRFGE